MSSNLTKSEREERARIFVALRQQPLTMEEALDFGLSGWNLRCNQCGSFGAQWLPGQRPGWGSLAACPTHRDEIRAETRRHEEEMRRLRTVHFEQPPRAEIEHRKRVRDRARKNRGKGSGTSTPTSQEPQALP